MTKKGQSSLLAGRCPQEQVDPVALAVAVVAFSVVARSQVQAPAGRAPK